MDIGSGISYNNITLGLKEKTYWTVIYSHVSSNIHENTMLPSLCSCGIYQREKGYSGCSAKFSEYYKNGTMEK